jgi:guanyl-specific ribonuclease Sa
MFKSGNQLIPGILLGIVLALFIGKQFFSKTPVHQAPTITVPVQPGHDNRNTDLNKANDNSGKDASIPQKVYDVLNYIRSHNHAMNGYVGGRVFSNREQILPRTDNNGNSIQYHEWDVNPKIEGQNRGTERIITGSDGRAWYTNDHYQSFKEIK